MRAAIKHGTMIIPLILPGYVNGHDNGGAPADAAIGRQPPWPPASSKEPRVTAAFEKMKCAIPPSHAPAYYPVVSSNDMWHACSGGAGT